MAALDAFGRIDILVNNAGIGLARGLADTSDDDLARVIDIDLVAVLRLTRDVMPHLARPGGRILNISSAFGVAVHPGSTAYAAAKPAWPTRPASSLPSWGRTASS